VAEAGRIVGAISASARIRAFFRAVHQMSPSGIGGRSAIGTNTMSRRALLDGVLDDPAEIDAVTATLRRIETKLVTRSRRRGAAGLSA
jgi:hypothetical protein